MSKYLFSNNASGSLAAEMTSIATEFSLGVGEGANFPNPVTGESFLVTLQVGADIEIVEVTARVGDVFTVARAREGTTARVWPVNTPVEMRLTAGIMASLFQLFANTVSFSKTLALGTLGKITGGTIDTATLTTCKVNSPDLRTASVKPVDGNTANAIVLPNGGGMPTINGSRILTGAGDDQMSGDFETSGGFKGASGTFGALHFVSGTSVYGDWTFTDADTLLALSKDTDITITANGGEARLKYDRVNKRWGFGTNAPAAFFHLEKATADDTFLRLKNAVNSFDAGVDSTGKVVLKNGGSYGLSYTIGGTETLAMDTVGRITNTVAGFSGNATGIRYISTSDPGGGSDGDIWLKV